MPLVSNVGVRGGVEGFALREPEARDATVSPGAPAADRPAQDGAALRAPMAPARHHNDGAKAATGSHYHNGTNHSAGRLSAAAEPCFTRRRDRHGPSPCHALTHEGGAAGEPVCAVPAALRLTRVSALGAGCALRADPLVSSSCALRSSVLRMRIGGCALPAVGDVRDKDERVGVRALRDDADDDGLHGVGPVRSGPVLGARQPAAGRLLRVGLLPLGRGNTPRIVTAGHVGPRGLAPPLQCRRGEGMRSMRAPPTPGFRLGEPHPRLAGRVLLSAGSGSSAAAVTTARPPHRSRRPRRTPSPNHSPGRSTDWRHSRPSRPGSPGCCCARSPRTSAASFVERTGGGAGIGPLDDALGILLATAGALGPPRRRRAHPARAHGRLPALTARTPPPDAGWSPKGTSRRPRTPRPDGLG